MSLSRKNQARPFFLYWLTTCLTCRCTSATSSGAKANAALYGRCHRGNRLVCWPGSWTLSNGPGSNRTPGSYSLPTMAPASYGESRGVGLSLARGQRHLLGRRHARALPSCVWPGKSRPAPSATTCSVTIDLFPTIGQTHSRGPPPRHNHRWPRCLAHHLGQAPRQKPARRLLVLLWG